MPILVVIALLAVAGALSSNSPAIAASVDDILGELKKQMSCERIVARDPCIEITKGGFVKAAEADRRFVLGRAISEKENGVGTEKIRVDFLTGPHRGAKYAKELDFPQATARENAIVPDVDLNKVYRVAMSPLSNVLGTRLPFMFLTLYGYLSGYSWFLSDGAVGGSHPILTGRPKASVATLPNVELRLEQKARTYIIDTLTFFALRGTQKAEMYKIAFEKYRSLPQKEVYRPMEMEITLNLGRRTEVEKLRFDEWLFRVEPTAAENRWLSQLNAELPSTPESKLIAIR